MNIATFGRNSFIQGVKGLEERIIEAESEDDMHTEGKIQLGSTGIKDVIILGPSPSKKYIANVVIEQISGGTIAEIMEAERKDNAKELVRRWNAFEEDGLVTELLDALESADLSLIECAKYLMSTGPVPDSEAIALTMIQVKAAINSAEEKVG